MKACDASAKVAASLSSERTQAWPQCRVIALASHRQICSNVTGHGEESGKKVIYSFVVQDAAEEKKPAGLAVSTRDS